MLLSPQLLPAGCRDFIALTLSPALHLLRLLNPTDGAAEITASPRLGA